MGWAHWNLSLHGSSLKPCFLSLCTHSCPTLTHSINKGNQISSPQASSLLCLTQKCQAPVPKGLPLLLLLVKHDRWLDRLGRTLTTNLCQTNTEKDVGQIIIVLKWLNIEDKRNHRFGEKNQLSSFCSKADLSPSSCTTVLTHSKSSSIMWALNIKSRHSVLFVCGFPSHCWLLMRWVTVCMHVCVCGVSSYSRVASQQCYSVIFLEHFPNPEWLMAERAKLVFSSNHGMDGENDQHQARAVRKACVTDFSCMAGNSCVQNSRM